MSMWGRRGTTLPRLSRVKTPSHLSRLFKNKIGQTKIFLNMVKCPQYCIKQEQTRNPQTISGLGIISAAHFPSPKCNCKLVATVSLTRSASCFFQAKQSPVTCPPLKGCCMPHLHWTTLVNWCAFTQSTCHLESMTALHMASKKYFE